MEHCAKQDTALSGSSCSEEVGVLPARSARIGQLGPAHSFRRLEYRTQVARGQKKRRNCFGG